MVREEFEHSFLEKIMCCTVLCVLFCVVCVESAINSTVMLLSETLRYSYAVVNCLLFSFFSTNNSTDCLIFVNAGFSA
jgi:hypothetical protein